MNHKTCVVHLTAVDGSMQASARVARFLAVMLKCPLLDSVDAVMEFCAHLPLAGRNATVFFVNGPIAFCGFRDELGSYLLPRTKTVYWVQQDYTITLPPNQAYSRATKAETPFRAEFHKVPHVHLWSTCHDVLARRQERQVPGYEKDEYVNWNALTYAPLGGTPEVARNRVLYYGALRAGRTDSLAKFFCCDESEDSLTISASNLNKTTYEAWRAVAPHASILGPEKMRGSIIAQNGNGLGAQSLLRFIAQYQHSLYVADRESELNFHSLANRFYEVLSTPGTVLWLDAAGAATYRAAGLKNWERFAVSSGEHLFRNARLPVRKLRQLARQQREDWLITDPFQVLRSQVLKLIKEL